MRSRADAGLDRFAYRCCERFLKLERERGGTGKQFHPPMSTSGAQKFGDVGTLLAGHGALDLPTHGPGGAPHARHPLLERRS